MRKSYTKTLLAAVFICMCTAVFSQRDNDTLISKFLSVKINVKDNDNTLIVKFTNNDTGLV